MARRVLAGFAPGLQAALVASVLVLQGCPLSDDYYIDENMDETGGTWARGGSSFAGSGAGGSFGGGVSGCHAESYGQGTYLFCTSEQSYASAETTCANAGMSLVIVDDMPENAWLLTTLDRWYFGAQPFGFIGADDRAKEGEWRFANGETFWNGAADGALVGTHFVRWSSGQPNDLSPVTLTQEDCGAVQFLDGNWNDVRCELTLPFVCEAD